MLAPRAPPAPPTPHTTDAHHGPRLQPHHTPCAACDSHAPPQWRVEPGAVDPEPLLLPAMPWDLGTVGAGGAGTVLFDPQDQLYKCW